jgi:hypothetical protein
LVAARPSGQPFEALDVAAGPDGRIYVLDGILGELRVYEWRKKDRLPAEGADPNGAPSRDSAEEK